FSRRRRHTRFSRDWSSDVCSSDLVYRTIDFRSNEFRGLRGGEQFEPVEENPMIGYRGCFRYVKEPDLFALELELLARVRDETPKIGRASCRERVEVPAGGAPRRQK